MRYLVIIHVIKNFCKRNGALRSSRINKPIILLLFAFLSLYVGCDRATENRGNEAEVVESKALADSKKRGETSRPKARSVIDSSTSSANPIRFRSAGAESGIDFKQTSGNSAEKYFPTIYGSGIAIFDFDGDGALDLFFATTRELPLDSPTTCRGNRLYRNRGDGSFEDVTEQSGLVHIGFCHGVAAGDFNGDGFIDLYIAALGSDSLYINDGYGRFYDQSASAGASNDDWSVAAAAFDYDGDGNLDLYATGYGRWAIDTPRPFCGDRTKGIRVHCSPHSIEPVRHALYRNRGDGTFENTTEAAGIARDDGRGLGVVAADLDSNGKIDLYIVNDECPNFLFLNRGDGRFDDVGELAGAARSDTGGAMAGMGVDAEDIDGDGRPELFVTNFRGEYNTLYRNLDGRSFQDMSARAGIVQDSLPDVGWGCALADFNSDGRPDMFVCNGHVDDNLQLLGEDVPQAEYAKIWRNIGDGKFRLVADPGPFFREPRVARSAAFGDLNDDGAIDIVVGLLDSKPALLWNESRRLGSWIGLDLIGRKSNRGAIGARVVVHTNKGMIMRQVKGGGSYLASNDPRLLIGVGAVDRIDRVEIDWPSGIKQTLTEVELDAMRVVREVEAIENATSHQESIR